MKQLFTYINILLLILLTPACDRKEEIDFDVKRNNIIGTWNMRRFSEEIRADTLYQAFETPVDICFSFKANGTGTRSIPNLDDPVPFEWYFQYDPARVVIADQNAVLFSLRNTIVYKVKTNESDLQVWSYEVSDSTGIADVYRHTLTFKKK